MNFIFSVIFFFKEFVIVEKLKSGGEFFLVLW